MPSAALAGADLGARQLGNGSSPASLASWGTTQHLGEKCSALSPQVGESSFATCGSGEEGTRSLCRGQPVVKTFTGNRGMLVWDRESRFLSAAFLSISDTIK